MAKRSAVIVGNDTLLGREIQQVLNEEAPHFRISLIGDETEASLLTERKGEPVVISALDEASLREAAVVFLTGTPESCRRSLEIVRSAPTEPTLIDLTHSLENEADSEVWAPLLDSTVLNFTDVGVHQVAHPAAIVLAGFLTQLNGMNPVVRSIVHVFEPASEYGREGIDELQKQTVNLLSFQKLPQSVFDIQLCFNLTPALGAAASRQLSVTEARIARHLKVLLSRSGGVSEPSLRVVQAPVFHGYSFSVWAEFSSPSDVGVLIKGLASKSIDVRLGEDTPPTNVGIAGQSGMAVGRIETDRCNPNAAWFWIVADNHHVAAENAVRLARLLVPAEGRA